MVPPLGSRTFTWASKSFKQVTIITVHLSKLHHFCTFERATRTSPPNLASRASISPTYRYFNRTYDGGVIANVIEQKATLLNNVDMIFEVEQFSNNTWKNVDGWKLPLSPFGCKMSVRFENMDRGPLWNNFPYEKPSAYLFLNFTLVVRSQSIAPFFF